MSLLQNVFDEHNFVCDIVCEGRKSGEEERESLLSMLYFFFCYLSLSVLGLTLDTKCKSAP